MATYMYMVMVEIKMATGSCVEFYVKILKSHYFVTRKSCVTKLVGTASEKPNTYKSPHDNGDKQ